jgi:hypothetical protein
MVNRKAACADSCLPSWHACKGQASGTVLALAPVREKGEFLSVDLSRFQGGRRVSRLSQTTGTPQYRQQRESRKAFETIPDFCLI